MTFIASVIAREGIAIVADSFGTQEEHSLDVKTLIDYLDKNKNKKNVPVGDLVNLFESRPTHTRNFQDKLVQFDGYSALTITGQSHINKKRLTESLKTIAAIMQADATKYEALTVDELLSGICNALKPEIVEHLKTDEIAQTEFIFSHYNRKANKPQIFVIKIKASPSKQTDINDADLISYEDRSYLKIVSDGQDTYVDRLIFGSLYTNITKVKRFFATYIFKKFRLSQKKKAEILTEIMDFDLLDEFVRKDVFYIKWRDLSVQEAVDLAALLIKIVMDIQIYTEKIPTVGGLIRLAVITKDKGFDWVSGDKITVPKIV